MRMNFFIQKSELIGNMYIMNELIVTAALNPSENISADYSDG